MKHITFLLNDEKKYSDACKQSQKKHYKAKLIQVFSGITDKQKIKQILLRLQKDFADAIIIGTTTAGEILSDTIHDESVVISLSLFKKTKLKTSYTKTINQKSGEKLFKSLCIKDTKAAVVLSEGMLGEDYIGFIAGMKNVNPNILIAGGLAGDNFQLKKTYVFYGTKILKSGAVAVSFSGKKLYANNDYNLNWTPIGKKFTVTKVDNNIIHTIDGISAKELFKKYLGERIFQNNNTQLSNFQLLFYEGSTIVARVPIDIQGDSIVLAGPMKQGEQFQFGFATSQNFLGGVLNICNQLKTKPIQAIYSYSCIARKTLLGKELQKEFAMLDTLAPVAGFFTYGEFYSTSINNTLLNCTTTLLALSESDKTKKDLTIDLPTEDMSSSTFQALANFINQTSLELEENFALLNEYKDVVDSSLLVSKTDIDGIITYVNDNLCKVSQYSKEELIGTTHNIMKNSSVPQKFFQELWQTILSKKIWSGLISNRAKDGSIFHLETTIMPILDEHDSIKEFITIAQDITKQIRSQAALQEKEQFIKVIFDNQENVVVYRSQKEGMISVNQKLFEYVDYKDFEEFKSKHNCICDLFIQEDGFIHPITHPNWIDDIANNPQEEHKVKILTKDSIERVFTIHIKKIHTNYIINLNDITQLELALKKAYASEQAKSEFLANMSHEIRTPLNGILGFANILSTKELPEDTKKYIDIINKSGETLLNVVNNILDFSKIESGDMQLSINEENLYFELEATVYVFASVAKKKNIDFYTYIDTKIPRVVQCDIQKLKQVVNNLVSNAIKFTPEYGTVTVEVVLLKTLHDISLIEIKVKDSGIGIAPEKISSIFESFSQADNSISREFGGTGLGLSISNQYVQMMGSQIEVKSVVDQGSEFYFTLALPIVDKHFAFEAHLNRKKINIKILDVKGKIKCEANEVIYKYLDNWDIPFQIITSLEDVDYDTEILILSTKLFDFKSNEHLKDTFKQLQVIYVEDGEHTLKEIQNSSCPNSHMLAQPVTGSALFGTIATILGVERTIEIGASDTQDKTKFEGKILVAEDNETNQMLISVILDEKGVDYTIVKNGQEVLDTIQKGDSYDLILMDINMPVMDGVSATKQLRADGYKKPIVSLSANVIEEDVLSYKQAGMDDTLAKPIDSDELNRVLKTYLKLPEEQSENEEFDDLLQASKELNITNKDMIKKIYNSFVITANEALEDIEKNGLTQDVVHNIKGVSGNIKLNKLFELSSTIDEAFYSLDKEAIDTQYQDIFKKHLTTLIEQIKNRL